MNNILSLFKSFLNIGIPSFGLFIICTFLLRWLSGDKFLVVRVTNYFMFWLGVLLILMLILVVMSKRVYTTAILLTAIILIGHSYFPLLTNCKKTALASSPSIKIMSYNIWRENTSMTAVADVIRSVKPDILLMQELLPYHAPALIKELKEFYRENQIYVVYDPFIKQVILSRYPIQNDEAFPRKGRAQKASIKTPFGLITVINIHAYKWRWLRRHRQMEALMKEDVIYQRGPIILGGDFNTNEQSQTFRLVNQYLRNAHWEVGCGFEFTYPTPTSIFKKNIPIPALIRIDHIFFSEHFIPIKLRKLSDSGGSDHFPVVAELVMNNN